MRDNTPGPKFVLLHNNADVLGGPVSRQNAHLIGLDCVKPIDELEPGESTRASRGKVDGLRVVRVDGVAVWYDPQSFS